MDRILSDEVINPVVLAEQQVFITKVYGWMTLALTLTGLTAWIIASSPNLTAAVFSNRLIFYALLGIELLMVLYLAVWISKISAFQATLAFVAYSIVNGLTLSIIFLIYTQSSITQTFFITAGTFGIMSAYGYYTKRDLTTIGNLSIMALLGLILASIVNLFANNPTLDWIITYAGILIFVALTAYDTQKIKQTNIIGNSGTDEDRKEAIMGALTLYLDFINLFLKLLRIFGKRK